MFNSGFFRKKDNKFSLDEHSLPSLSEIEPKPSSSSAFPSDDSLAPQQEQPKDDYSSTPPMASFSNQGFGNQSLSTPVSNSNTPFRDDSKSIHEEVSRAKLDTMEAKMALMEARLAGIEQRLDIVMQILKYEMSDETKKKMSMDHMRDSFKK